MSDAPPVLQHVLALDCSTERLSLALAVGRLPQPGATQWCGEVLTHDGASGAQASLHLMAHIQTLLDQAGLHAQDLGAIAYGRGPGAFTGLRTACAVAQGLAFGANDRPVIGISALMAVAQDARLQGETNPLITALLDARMNELYAATHRFDGALVPAQPPLELEAPALVAPEHITEAVGRWQAETATPVLAGNTEATYGAHWAQAPWRARHHTAWPSARAMLHLVPALWAAGAATEAAQAQPVYVRDRVALTTAERQARATA
jgi:tRNA threonylcarbamoyladenosine biosynthesis protein TsaB